MIGIIGLGYVGLTTALCFSEIFNVAGFDIDKEKIKILKERKIPFKEPGLESLLEKNYDKTFFITDLDTLVNFSKFIFICLPVKTENIDDDVQYLTENIENILKRAKEYKIIIIKSTVLPGTCDRVKLNLAKYNFDLIMNPEFLSESTAVTDFFNPGRIVLGGGGIGTLGITNTAINDIVDKLYRPYFSGSIIKTNRITTEFIKYLSNCFLATLISFSNEMALLAENMENIDIKTAFSTLHLDKRFGDGTISNWVYPGCGYGGWCLPKDTKALYNNANKKYGSHDMKMLKAVMDVNQDKMVDLIEKILIEASHNHNIFTIGVLGLSFKSGTSDTRNSVAEYIVLNLLPYQYHLILYDPLAMNEFKKKFPELEYAYSTEDLIQQADLIVVLNKDEEYKKVAESKKPYIDGRYFL